MKHLTKSFLAIFIFATFFSFSAKAQSVETGNSIISIGYGFPNLGKSLYKALSSNTDYKVSGIGPLHLKYEYMISDNIGVGASINFVSFGASYTVSRDSLDANFNPVHYTTKYTLATKNYSVLFRFNYHFYTEDKIDAYYGVGAGYRNGKTTYKTTPNDPNYTFSQKVILPVGFETTLGLRYLITDNFGIYTEIGIGKSLIQFGGCLKL